jgi:hypothetical protein
VVLADLYEQDRHEHAAVPPVGTAEYNALRARDKSRRASAQAALASLRRRGTLSAADLFHAAWLYNHGESPADAQRAHELASDAAKQGHSRARWLAAASFDRWCMYEGRPQRYGTQFVPDGKRYRLWDVDPSTTDADRAEWDVPPLADQLRRAEEMTARHPQPLLAQAPQWLKDAVERWNATGETDAREAGAITSG